MSIKSIKEKQLLVNLANYFGQKVDKSIIEDVNIRNNLVNNIKENIRSNVFEDLSDALDLIKNETNKVSQLQNNTLPNISDHLIEKKVIIVEEKNEEIGFSRSLTDLASEAITASAKRDSFQQPDPLLVAPDINSIQKKIRYLEQWIAKLSETGPGGGAGSVARLDHETKLVTTPYYEITTKDFYIGINYNGNVTITLPSIINAGRMYIIKDESGNCSVNPITVLGTVDNDAGGFILQQDNGGVQLIYRNGWRIV